MRVALVHDYLNQYGGGERVLENLMEIFPEAPIYTLFYDEKRTNGRFRGRIGGTSFLDKPFVRKNHRLFIPLMPLAAQTITIDHDYDLVISDSAGFSKGINISCHRHSNCYCPRHISYIHTPLRYAWETDSYFSNPIFRTIFRPVFKYLKKWDYRAGQKPDLLLANSNFIAGKIKKYYGREAIVVYPPVASKFYFEAKSKSQNPNHKYYLAIGRLLHYKRFDLIIDSFAEMGLPLKIVGLGPEENKIKNQISKIKNIELIPFVDSEDDLRKLYSGAKALIFPQVEDFGLVAAEAQACGTPVIAYAAGGALEIVKDGETGIFFHEQTASNLAEAVRRFEKMKFNREKISQSAQRFSKEKFKRLLLNVIDNL